MSEEVADGVKVRLPRPLMQHVNAPSSLTVEAGTLRELVDALDQRFPGLAGRILDDQGRVRRFVIVFVNERMLDEAAPERVQVRPGDEVYIVPSVAGG